MFNEQEFIASIQRMVDWWNARNGTTCELSLGYDEHLPRKMELLAGFNAKISGGIWLVHHCSACVSNTEGQKPLHAMIWKTPHYKDLPLPDNVG